MKKRRPTAKALPESMALLSQALLVYAQKCGQALCACRRRVIAAVLAAAMLMSMMPAISLGVAAEETDNGGSTTTAEGHMHPVCGASCDHETIHDTVGPWTAITSAAELAEAAKNGGNYYLAQDISLDAETPAITVSADLSLCLNGKILTCYSSATASAFTVSGGKTLNLTDCSTATTHGYIDSTTGLWEPDATDSNADDAANCDLIGGVITGSTDTTTHGSAVMLNGTLNMYGGNIAGNSGGEKYGAGIFVNNDGIFNLYGGSITGNTATHGGGVYSEGTVTVSGGTIQRNTATSNGGGVYVAEDSLIITSGSISGNTATKNGGGVYSSGAVTVSGGEISGNTSAEGGGVYVAAGSLTMTNGSIRGNTATSNGGGINIGAGCTTTMTGGTISGNIAKSNGGGVCVLGASSGDNPGVFNLQGGSITGNESGNHGGGIHTSRGNVNMTGGTITLNKAGRCGGGVVVYGNTNGNDDSTLNMTGGIISNNTSTSQGGGIYAYADSKVNFGGNAVVCGNVKGGTITDGVLSGGSANNLYLGDGLTVSTSAAQTDSTAAPITLTTGAFIGVTTATAPAADTPVAITTADSTDSTDYSVFFFADSAASYHIESSATQVQLTYGSTNYSVTVDENITGGAVTVSPTEAAAGSTVTVTADTANNYSLKGLTVKTTGGYAVYVQNTDGTYSFTMPASNVTVSAEFSLPGCTVTFVAEEKTVDTVTVEQGGKVQNIPAVPEKVGYTGSWKLGSEDFTTETVIENDITVEAVYTIKTYKVTYVADDATEKEVEVEHGGNVQDIPAVPEKDGYSGEWDHDGTNITADITITAVYFVKTYTVTWIADGVTVATAQVKYNEDAEAPEVPVKPLYNGSWSSDSKNITADTTITAIYSLKEHDHTGWTAITSAAELAEAAEKGGNYYLANNISGLTATVTVKADMTLCLNGKILTGSGSASVITVTSGATLNLMDCGTEVTQGYINSTTGLWTQGTDVSNGSKDCDLIGGVITGGSGSFGGGVTVHAGTLNLYGGNIAGNTATTSYGGGVYVRSKAPVNSEFNMYGGSIIGNTTAENYGGGVMVLSGTFNLYGGAISKNTAYSGKDTIYHNAGGVQVGADGTFHMYGGAITDNTSICGGGVYVSEGIFHMSGGVITGNTAASAGGVYMHKDSTVSLGGNAVISGNTNGNLYLVSGETVSVSGLTEGASIGVTTAKAPTTSAPVAITGKCDADYSGYFFWDGGEAYFTSEEGVVTLNLGHGHPICGASCDHETTHDTVGPWVELTQELLDSNATLGSAGKELYYYLADNLTATNTIEIKGTVNLCLNGKVLTGYNKSNAIKVTSGAMLNLTDCSDAVTNGYIDSGTKLWKPGADVPDGSEDCDLIGGVITGGNVDNDSDSGLSGGGVYIDQGTLNLYGGNIAGNKATGSKYGGGVYIHTNGGTFNMYGGTVTGNTTNSAGGGGVYVFNGVFNMTGGEISGNTAAEKGSGGGVYLHYKENTYNGVFNMTGGSITGNTASTHGGGVYMASGSTVSLGGDAVISGNIAKNTVCNLYIPQNNTVTVGVLDGAYIGVTTGGAPAEGSPVAITGSNTADYSMYFFADNAGYHIDNESDTDNAVHVVKLYAGAGSYNVSTPEVTGGSASVNGTPAAGDTVIVTVTADTANNYSLKGLTVKTAGGYAVDVTQNADGTYSFTMPASDVVITPEFSLPTYTVYFVINNVVVGTQEVAQGGSVTLPEIPAKEGYTGNWDKDGTNITEDTFLTAVYTINTYTVTFTGEDGTTVGTVTVEHGSTVTQFPEVPEKEGYTGDWDYDGAGITKDTTIIAVYSVRTCTVTWVADGLVVATERVSYQESVTAVPEVPEKDGYTGSWSHDGKNITADTTIIAVYLLTGHDTAHTGWNKITSERDLSTAAKEGGSWYLAADITLTGTVTVSGDLTLCLNGKTITGISVGNSIIVKGGTLTLLDCSSETTHGYIYADGLWKADPENDHAGLSDECDLIGGVITGGNIANTGDLSGGGIVIKGGTFNMYGGNIAGNKASGAKYGGGVYIDSEGGTFNMYGGTVTGNTTQQDKGAGVFVFDGKFNLYGGSITRNTNASNNGGGVYLNLGTFNMSGGSIIDNTATNGAGVYVGKGTFNLAGGVISGNKATSGAGVYVYTTGAFNMTGGSILNNTSSGSGGGVYIYTDASTMSGGLISGNKAVSGGGVFVLSGEFKMTGGEISGNTATKNYGGGVYLNYSDRETADYVASFIMTGGSITGNTANAYSGGVYVNPNSSFTLEGDPVITGNVRKGTVTEGGLVGGTADNIYLPADALLTLRTLKDGALLGVNTANDPTTATPIAITGINNGDYSKYFLSDIAAYHAESVDSILYLAVGHAHPVCGRLCGCNGDESHSSIDWIAVTTAAALAEAAKKGGNYYLANDITLTGTITVSTELNLCLNGKTLTGSGSSSVLTVNGTLNLTDCSTATTHGYIDSTGLWMADTDMTHTGAADECDLPGGIITGGNGGIYVDDGTVNLYGGNIAGNGGIKVNGGGVYMTGEDTTFHMYGGSITGNIAENGGGVHVSGGTFSLHSGTVNNNAANNGSGAYVNGGTVNLYGGSVTGNTATNGSVYVSSGTVTLNGVTLSGNTATNGGGMYVNGGTVTLNGVTLSGNTAENGGGMYVNGGTVSLSGVTVIRKNNGGNLYLAENVTVSVSLTDGASIGITTAVVPVEGTPVIITGTNNSDCSAYFLADDAVSYHIESSSSQEVQLCAGATEFQVNLTYPEQYGTASLNGTSSGITADCGSTVTVTATAANTTTAYVKDVLVTDAEGNPVAVTKTSDGSWTFVVPASDVTVTVRIIPYHDHPDCGSSCTCGGSHESVRWGEIFTEEDLIAAAANGGYYYLVGDVTLTSNITVTAESFRLCLNGMVLTGSGTGYVLTVSDSTDMILTDCGSTVRYYDSTDGLWVLNSALTSGELSTTGGVITGGNGGIWVDGDLSMYGGNIVGNTAENGGGVYVDGYANDCGSFTVYGGRICGNTATNGGGVYVNGYNTVFTLSGGEISGNTAENGGGLYLFHCQYATMTGGTICGNTAENGGGVFAGRSTYFTMSGGEISGNTATVYGGGIQASGYGAYIEGTAVISGNTAANGGGVYAANAHFSVSGSSKITDNKASASGGGVYADGSSFFLSGSPVVDTNSLNTTENNLYLPADKYITVNGAMGAGANVGVTLGGTDGVFAKHDGTTVTSLDSYQTYFSADNADTTSVTDEKHLALGYCVNFVTNGGSAVANQYVVNGGTVTKPSTIRTGYSLDGWYTDDALTTAFDFNTSISSSMTLYAKWTETVEISVDTYAGSLTLDDVVYVNIGSVLTNVPATVDLTKDAGLLIWYADPGNTAFYATAEERTVGMTNAGTVEGYQVYASKTNGILAKDIGKDMWLLPYVEVKGTYYYGTVLKYSPLQYCRNMISKDDTEDEMKDLCYKLLNFGAAVQDYEGKTGDLVNAGYEQNIPEELTRESIAVSYQVDQNKLPVTAESGLDIYAAMLTIADKIHVNYRYTVNIADAQKVTLYVWSAEQYAAATKLSFDAAAQYEMTAFDGEQGNYIAQTDGVVARELNKAQYTCVCVETSDGTTYYSDLNAYSPQQYAYNKFEDTNSYLANLVKWMVLYGRSTAAYHDSKSALLV